MGAVSFFTDIASEMMYPLLPIFLSTVLGASASFIGTIEGAAESVASLLKLASGWWSDRASKRKPLVLLGYGIASFIRPLTAIAQSAGQVLAIRLTDRVGKGIRTTPRDALIAESVHPSIRGRAFGFHSAADNAGAVVGPLLAFVVLAHWHTPLRTVFWWTLLPGTLAFLVLIFAVKDIPRKDNGGIKAMSADMQMGQMNALEPVAPMPSRFWMYLTVVLIFTLGNSTDAFLLLRANQLGVPILLAPVLWALLNFVKAALGTYGGALSDRMGRRPLIIAGWMTYAAVYLAFGLATAAWEAWALFAAYGLFYAMAEGTERALVIDLVPPSRKGTALGWYNLAIGLGALPASLLFGMVWDRAGSAAAFTMGATLALLATMGIWCVVPRRMDTLGA
jgi:MFS family permease